MQTLTLCETVTGLHSHPLHPKITRRPRRFSPFRSLRYSRRCSWCASTEEKFMGRFQQASRLHKHGTDLHSFDGGDNSMEFADIKHSESLMNITSQCINSAEGSSLANSVQQDRVPKSEILYGLKFIFLIGLAIFQGSQQAIASTEITGAMQPLIEDLGDISTGFASVRKASLQLSSFFLFEAFLLIFFSELGDKTFFIAALLAARNSSVVVFIGTFGALAAMSLVSVILGRTFHYVDGILPFRFGETDFPIDDFAAICLLVYFGVTTLLEAASGDESKLDEEQKEAEVAISEFSGNGAGIMAATNTVISTFLLVFVAEWGDKSFFSTIALAAASSPLGVIGGALGGHALATLLAVVGGSILGTYFSEKAIAYIGGSLFLVFAVVTLIETLK